MYDYTTNTVLKVSTSTTVVSHLDCIDSSTCIGVNSSLTHFSRLTNSNFLGSLLTFNDVQFSAALLKVPLGLRCFETVKKCIVYSEYSNVYFDPYSSPGYIMLTHNLASK